MSHGTLHSIILLAKENELKKVVERYPNINELDDTGATALHVAVMTNKLTAVQILVKKGINVNAINKAGLTALHCAANMGNLTITLYLITKSKASVSLTTQNDKKDTVLTLLLNQPNKQFENVTLLQCIDALSYANVNFNVVDMNGNTPLHFAVMKDHYEIIPRLLQYRAVIDTANNKGKTPLHIAAKLGNVEVLSLLLDKGASLSRKTNTGKTPIDIAKEHNQTQVETILNNAEKNKEGNASWETISSDNLIRYNHIAVNFGEKVFIMGGRSHFKAAKAKIYYNDLWTFNNDTKKWEEIPTKGQLPPPLACHSSCSIGKNLYISGGVTQDKNVVTSFWNLDLNSFEWQQLPVSFNEINLPETSAHLCTISRIDLVLVGYDKKQKIFNQLAVFNTVSNAITVTQMKDGLKFPTYREFYSLSRVRDYIYLFGGKYHKNFLNDLWILFVKEGIWLAPITSGHIPPARYGHGSVYVNGIFYVFGGISPQGEVLNDLYGLDVKNLVWKKFHFGAQSLPIPRAFLSAVTEGNQRFYLVGGSTPNQLDIIKPISFSSAFVNDLIIEKKYNRGELIEHLEKLEEFSRKIREETLQFTTLLDAFLVKATANAEENSPPLHVDDLLLKSTTICDTFKSIPTPLQINRKKFLDVNKGGSNLAKSELQLKDLNLAASGPVSFTSTLPFSNKSPRSRITSYDHHNSEPNQINLNNNNNNNNNINQTFQSNNNLSSTKERTRTTSLDHLSTSRIKKTVSNPSGPIQTLQPRASIPNEKEPSPRGGVGYQRSQFLHHFIQKENEFAIELSMFIKTFADPLKSKEIISQELYDKLFKPLEAVVDFSKKFSVLLMEEFRKTPENQSYSAVFKSCQKDLRMFVSYQNQLPTLVSELDALGKDNSEFNSFVDSLKTTKDWKCLPFDFYFFIPVFKVKYYIETVKDLSKFTPSGNSEANSLARTLKRLKLLLVFTDSIKSYKVDASFDLNEMKNRFVSAGVRELSLLTSLAFIRETTVKYVKNEKKPDKFKTLVLFLFKEKMLIAEKKKSSKLIPVQSIKSRNISFTEVNQTYKPLRNLIILSQKSLVKYIISFNSLTEKYEMMYLVWYLQATEQ